MTDASEAAAPATPRSILALLALVLLLAGALRVWNATQGLASGTHYDERYSFHNVAGILRFHELVPRQPFYPSLSYLPQTLVLLVSEELHRATGAPALAIYARTADGWSPTAYLLARLTNVGFGVASLLLVFVVGRRIFGPVEGLLAAAALAAFPRHLISSTHFKPDILVTLLTLLTFHWTLRAARRPGAGTYARCGVGVGLAAAAKYNGAGAAVAPAALALLRWRERRAWMRLALAAVVAVLTFVALNPFLSRLLLFARQNSRIYANEGAAEGSDRAVVVRREGLFLLQHHGWVAAFLVLGLLGMAWMLARRELPGEPVWSPRRRTDATLLLAQIVGYAALFTLGFPLFRGQNFLPVAPFTSLVSAWAMAALYRALRARAAVLARPAIAGALLALPLLLLVWGQLDEVYRNVVPTTWEVATGQIESALDRPPIRQVACECAPGLLRPSGGRGMVAITTPSLLRLGATPELSDVELYRHGSDYDAAMRTRAAGAASDARRASEAIRTSGVAPRGERREIAARLFRRRGETLELALHPWMPSTPLPLALASSTPATGREPALTAALPAELAPGAIVSLSVWLPRAAPAPANVRLEPAGVELPLTGTDRARGEQRLLTPRFVVSASTRTVRLAAPPRGPRPPRLEALAWTRR